MSTLRKTSVSASGVHHFVRRRHKTTLCKVNNLCFAGESAVFAPPIFPRFSIFPRSCAVFPAVEKVVETVDNYL